MVLDAEVSVDACLSCATAAVVSSIRPSDSCILWLQHTPSRYSDHPQPHKHTHHLTHFIQNTRPAQTIFHDTHLPSIKWATKQGYRRSSLLLYISFPVSSPFSLRNVSMHIMNRPVYVIESMCIQFVCSLSVVF